MPALVSILIPAHNAERWVEETLRSVLAQTWKRTEVIFVDDGSTDQTLTVAKEFASAGVKIISQPNRGASAARNVAYRCAQGEWIQWLDADDVLDSEKVEKQLLMASSPEVLSSSSWSHFYHSPSKARFTPTRLWEDLAPIEWLTRKIGESLWMTNSSWLINRTLADRVGPWDETLSTDDDGEYFCRLVAKSKGIQFVPEARSFYRRSSFSSLNHIGLSETKGRSQLNSLRMQISYLLALEDSVRTHEAALRGLQAHAVEFYPMQMILMNEAESLAQEMGGVLFRPKVSWKYRPLEAMFGSRFAKRVELSCRQAKDRCTSLLEPVRNTAPVPVGGATGRSHR